MFVWVFSGSGLQEKVVPNNLQEAPRTYADCLYIHLIHVYSSIQHLDMFLIIRITYNINYFMPKFKYFSDMLIRSYI